MKKLTVIGLVLVCLLVLSCAPPKLAPAPAPAPAPTAPLPAAPHTLDDLAYIQAEGRPYSDDADPEPEGAEITILWYDTESELICFEAVPVKVTIEIFAAKSEEFPRPFTESVYKGEHHIDNYHSNIRIPFEQIKANPGIHHWCGGANITVLTPQQEDFSVEGILVPLCPKPPLKPPPVPAPLPAPAPTPAPIPTARIGDTIPNCSGQQDLSLTLLWWKESDIVVNGEYISGYYTFTAVPGRKFIILAYEFRNDGKREQETPCLTIGEIVTAPKGYCYKAWKPPLGIHSEEYNPRKATSEEIYTLIGDSGGYEHLLPEESVNGRMVFEVAQETTPLEATIMGIRCLIKF